MIASIFDIDWSLVGTIAVGVILALVVLAVAKIVLGAVQSRA